MGSQEKQTDKKKRMEPRQWCGHPQLISHTPAEPSWAEWQTQAYKDEPLGH